MSITLNLPPETEQRLREKAAKHGQTVEAYLEGLAREETRSRNGTNLPSTPPLDPAEFDRQLDELSRGLPPLPPLPADFSRADLYADHE